MNIRLERLNKETLHHVITIHQKVYGKILTTQQLNAKYRTVGPFSGIFGILAFDGGAPVGFMGIVPMLLEYQNKYEWSGFLVDGMTLPSHRSWVLFTRILRDLHELLASEGITCVWTNSVPQTALLYNKRIGWTAGHNFSAYKIPVMGRRSAFVRRKILGIFNKEIREIFKHHLICPKSFNSFEGPDVVRICRNNEFLEYKSPGNSFFAEYDGCTIWLKQLSILCIGDIQINDPEKLDRVMKWLIPLSRRAGAPEIIFQTSPDSVSNNCFAAKYTSFPSWTLGYYNISSEFPLEKLRVTWGDMDTF